MKPLILAAAMLYPGTGGYFGQDYQAAYRTPSGRYETSVRAKAFHYAEFFKGTEVEYSGRLARHLPHVSIAARVGTAPPNAQRASYHVAGGEAILTFYGLRLGPSDVSTLSTVVEDTTTLADLSGLDERWITRARARYTSANHHGAAVTPGGKGLDIVQNTWQFDASLAYDKRTRLTLDGGGERYSKDLLPTDRTWFLWNVDYAGAPIAMRGWPRNHFGAQLERVQGPFTFRGAFTRVNMVSGDMEALAGGDVAWRPGTSWDVRAGWFQRHERHHETRSVWAFGASRRW